MIGNIISIKDGEITIKLKINIYEIKNIIDKYIVFDKCIVGIVNSAKCEYITSRVIGVFEDKKFIFGNLITPNFNSDIRLITKEELDIMYYVNKNDNYIKLGYDYKYNNYEINMNVQNFFSSHFAIFGGTGSGKSYATSHIIQSIFYDARALPFRTNIFLFDTFGEYERAFLNIGNNNENINYKIYTTEDNSNYERLFIPFWLLSVDDISLLLGVQNKEQILVIEKALKYVYYIKNDDNNSFRDNIIARCILDIIYTTKNAVETKNKIVTILTKFNTSNINLEVKMSKGGWIRSLRQCIDVIQGGKFADIEVVIKYLDSFATGDVQGLLFSGGFRYTMSDFYSALEYALMSEGIYNSDRVYDNANILRVRLDDICNSNKASFFDYDKYIDIDMYIKLLLTTKGEKKCQVVNFNISGVDERFANSLVKIYSRILFDYTTKLKVRGSVLFHILVEEAHRYIKNDTDNDIIGYNIFERIAKEGRKYGTFLGLISQRPSEVNETVISQCQNFMIFKIINPKDHRSIEDIMPSVRNGILNNLSNLNPGYSIIFGNAFNFPLLVKINMPNPTPLSENVDINNIWYIKQ